MEIGGGLSERRGGHGGFRRGFGGGEEREDEAVGFEFHGRPTGVKKALPIAAARALCEDVAEGFLQRI